MRGKLIKYLIEIKIKKILDQYILAFVHIIILSNLSNQLNRILIKYYKYHWVAIDINSYFSF